MWHLPPLLWQLGTRLMPGRQRPGADSNMAKPGPELSTGRGLGMPLGLDPGMRPGPGTRPGPGRQTDVWLEEAAEDM